MQENKPVNLTSEDLNYLIELGKKMNQQSNRMTQFPMFVVKQKVKRYGDCSWCDEVERVDGVDYNDLCENCHKKMENNEDYSEYCDDCDEKSFVWFKWDDKIVEECGSFFTSEAAEQHIRLNHYHYHEPFVYGIPSWRNFEMQKVLKILSKLGGDGKALNHYK